MEYDAKTKYYKMKRFYDKLHKISTNNGSAISTTDAADAAEDFFNQCYHFKDWLWKDTRLQIPRNIVEDFVSSSHSLSLAADFCNTFKHAGLDRAPRSGHDITKINTHTKLNLTDRGWVTSSLLQITIGAFKYDAFTLATDCINEWDRFLSENQIEFSAP